MKYANQRWIGHLLVRLTRPKPARTMGDRERIEIQCHPVPCSAMPKPRANCPGLVCSPLWGREQDAQQHWANAHLLFKHGSSLASRTGWRRPENREWKRRIFEFSLTESHFVSFLGRSREDRGVPRAKVARLQRPVLVNSSGLALSDSGCKIKSCWSTFRGSWAATAHSHVSRPFRIWCGRLNTLVCNRLALAPPVW